MPPEHFGRPLAPIGPGLAGQSRFPINGARIGVRQDVARPEVVDRIARRAVGPAARRHALLVDSGAEPRAWLCRLGGLWPSGRLERATWRPGPWWMAACRDACRARPVACAGQLRCARATGLER